MFLFVDGQPVILNFEQVEQLYYQSFIEEFGAISITQWRGSYEYQCLYPAIQLMVENGVITQEAIDYALGTIAAINEEIKRPAVLHSRVAERFLEAGYIATIRLADEITKGIVAICVDYEATPVNRLLTVGNDAGINYGFSASYGALDNIVFDGITINVIACSSDYSLPFRIITAGGAFPNFPDEISVNFTGFGVVVIPWSATNSRYEIADNALTDFIVAADGTDVTFRIENESTTDPTQDEEIANLIVNEMLPAGQHIEGNIFLPVVISNGQSVTARWTSPDVNDVDFKITLTRATNSQYPVDTVDDIVAKFLANFEAQNALGQDITPETYYQIATDAPWASKIVTTYSLNGGADTGDIYPANFDDKFIATLDPVNVVIL